MGIDPWVVGQTHPVLVGTFVDDSGKPVDLTGATTVMRIKVNGGPAFSGAGVLTVTNAAGGLFTYTVDPTDVAVAGGYSMRVRATYADGRPIYSDRITFQVQTE